MTTEDAIDTVRARALRNALGDKRSRARTRTLKGAAGIILLIAGSAIIWHFAGLDVLIGVILLQWSESLIGDVL